MLTRVWRGATTVEDAHAYLDDPERTGLAEDRSTAGNVGVLALRHVGGGRAEVVPLTRWHSMDTERIDAERRFAGTAAERAVFSPEDDRFLVERDERVAHSGVVFRAPA